MREFTYVKRGVFLYEFKTSQHYDDDPPRRLYDISGARVYPLEGSYDPERSFRVVTRSSEGHTSSSSFRHKKEQERLNFLLNFLNLCLCRDRLCGGEPGREEEVV